MNKRCFNTQEAHDYLGVKRRFFDKHLAPLLAGKGIPAGTSVVYERADIDDAWNRYKLAAGNGRPAQPEGSEKWDVQKQQVSTPRKTGHMKLMPTTKSTAFDSAVSRGLQMRKPT